MRVTIARSPRRWRGRSSCPSLRTTLHTSWNTGMDCLLRSYSTSATCCSPARPSGRTFLTNVSCSRFCFIPSLAARRLANRASFVHGGPRGPSHECNRLAKRPTRRGGDAEKPTRRAATLPSMDWTDAEGRAPLLAAAPIVVPVAEVSQTSVRTRSGRVRVAYHLTPLCALGVCAQTACCCSSLRPARPRRGWKLPSTALEQALPRGASWAPHKRRHSLRPLCSSCCSGRWWRPWPCLSAV